MFAVHVAAQQASKQKNLLTCVQRCALFPTLATDLTYNTYSFPGSLSDALARSIGAEPTGSGVQTPGPAFCLLGTVTLPFSHPF